MTYPTRQVAQADAEVISALVQHSFADLAARDWETNACTTFFAESSPPAMQAKLAAPAYAAAAFDGDKAIGFILMPVPSRLSMLFVDPGHLRQGVGRALWEQARSFVRGTYPDTIAVELNSTPYAYAFYRALGFSPISTAFVHGGCRATRMACPLSSVALPNEPV